MSGALRFSVDYLEQSNRFFRILTNTSAGMLHVQSCVCEMTAVFHTEFNVCL